MLPSRDSLTRRPLRLSALRPTSPARTGSAGTGLKSGGGTMRTRALLAALAVTLALATAAPAVAGQEQATRIVWTQVLDDEFTTARIVSARPDGSGLRALTHPAAGEFDLNAVISPDGSRVAFERDLRRRQRPDPHRRRRRPRRARPRPGLRRPLRRRPRSRLDPRRPTHHLHPGDRTLRPGQRLGPVGCAPYRQAGRQRDAAAVGARHRRGVRGLPRPLRPQRQIPDLRAGPQP